MHSFNKSINYQNPSSEGYYGDFGGAYIPEMLYSNVETLKAQYIKIMQDPEFQKEFHALLNDYVGRPTPLFYAERLSKEIGTKIYLKREDLCHTGAHKINNTIGQILLAKRLGKKKNNCRNRCWPTWCGNGNCLCIKRNGMCGLYG